MLATRSAHNPGWPDPQSDTACWRLLSGPEGPGAEPLAQHVTRLGRRPIGGTWLMDVLDASKHEVSSLRLRNLKSGESWDFPASAMFLGIGHIPNATFFAGQLETDADGYLITHKNVFTKVPGVFACGDVQDRRYRQAITAAGSGCMAALEVEKYLEEVGH